MAMVQTVSSEKGPLDNDPMMSDQPNGLNEAGEIAAKLFRRYGPAALGILCTIGLWELGGQMIAMNPDTSSFSDFAPGPTFNRLVDIVGSGEVIDISLPSLSRIGLGLLWAIVLGVPMGIAIGRMPFVRSATHLPFQFLRMISPLAWMPIAVLAFNTWNAAIVFLIFAAAVWPITFATANGLRKVDPKWFRVAQNLGARGWHMLMIIIMPAIAQDVLTGIRLALGVAWVVLVPAEYLGVTSGLGYAINDARDTLEYDRITAIVIVIGFIGFALDGLCLRAIQKYSWVKNS